MRYTCFSLILLMMLGCDGKPTEAPPPADQRTEVRPQAPAAVREPVEREPARSTSSVAEDRLARASLLHDEGLAANARGARDLALRKLGEALESADSAQRGQIEDAIARIRRDIAEDRLMEKIRIAFDTGSHEQLHELLQEVQLRRFQKRCLTKQEADFLARQGFGMK